MNEMIRQANADYAADANRKSISKYMLILVEVAIS